MGKVVVRVKGILKFMNGYAADLKQVCGCNWAATGMTQDEVVGKV